MQNGGILLNNATMKKELQRIADRRVSGYVCAYPLYSEICILPFVIGCRYRSLVIADWHEVM
jgi:hypothetical protein